MPTLSLVVIAKNEERNLGRCLDSVPFATEKLVLDSGSTDQTVAIAKAHGARVVFKEWAGFYLQKKAATEMAQSDWILSLDADEALSPELAAEIQELMAKGPVAGAYAMPRLSFHLGRWIRHGGWYPDWQIRLFDRRKAQWQAGELHEKIKADHVVRLRSPIKHWVFTGIADQVETNNRYSGLGAIQLHKEGRKFRLWRLILKSHSKFIETYIWKRGFLDGLPGFIIAVGAAYSMFLKHSKLWEIEHLSRTETGQDRTRSN